MTVRPLHNIFLHLLFIKKNIQVVQKIYLLPERCHGHSAKSVTVLDYQNVATSWGQVVCLAKPLFCIYNNLVCSSFTFEQREPFKFEWIWIGCQCCIDHQLKKSHLMLFPSLICIIIVVWTPLFCLQ